MDIEKTAQDVMKLEVVVKMDGGKVVCHQIVDANKNNASSVQMSESAQIRPENVDQNSLHSGSNIAEKPKEKSYFSKFMAWGKSKIPKSWANRETSDVSNRAKQSNLKTEEKSFKSNESQPLAVKEKHVEEPKPKRTAALAPPKSDGLQSKVPAHDSKLDDSFTNQKAVPPKVGLVENKPAEKRIRPKMSPRDDEKGHWPLFDKKPVESMCKMANCRTPTRVYCEKCDLHLCFNISRNCFYKFHKQTQHARVDSNKQAVKSSENTHKQSKPSNKIRTNKSGQIKSNVKDKTPIQHQDIAKDATKEKTKTRLGVPLRVNKIIRMTRNKNCN